MSKTKNQSINQIKPIPSQAKPCQISGPEYKPKYRNKPNPSIFFLFFLSLEEEEEESFAVLIVDGLLMA
jgi:hypothetical protein